jgi:hypothetical protein
MSDIVNIFRRFYHTQLCTGTKSTEAADSMPGFMEEGEMLRHLTLDPSKNYQAIGRADVSTMS